MQFAVGRKVPSGEALSGVPVPGYRDSFEGFEGWKGDEASDQVVEIPKTTNLSHQMQRCIERNSSWKDTILNHGLAVIRSATDVTELDRRPQNN